MRVAIRINQKLLLLTASSLALFLGSCETVPMNHNPVEADDVYVSVGTPRHWTLDDAHYLISGLHERSRDIKLEPLDGLDPNSFNRTRLKEVETAFKLSAEYNQLKGIKNKAEVDKLERDQREAEQAAKDEQKYKREQERVRSQIEREQSRKIRRQKVVTQHKADLAESERRRTRLLEDKSTAEQALETAKDSENTAEIGAAEKDLKAASDAIRSEDIKIERSHTNVDKAEAEVKESEDQITLLESREGQLSTDIKAASDKQEVATVELTEAQPPDLSGGAQDKTNDSTTLVSDALTLLKGEGDFKKGLVPSFSVSDRLANQINAENELLARQLTMLRDEVGPGKTIVFLELPHTIHAAHKTSKARHVQVQWSINSVCLGDPYYLAREVANLWERKMKEKPSGKILEGTGSKLLIDAGISDQTLGLQHYQINRISAELETNVDRYLNKGVSKRDKKIETIAKLLENSINEQLSNPFNYKAAACSFKSDVYKGEKDNSRAAAAQDAIAWDLIPRTNAYNVAEYSAVTRRTSIAGFLSLVTGIGASGQYDRREQRFENFATQNVHATSFGQGESTFGWVFNPKPGAKRVAGGSKTTFAALIVDKRVTNIELKTNSCVIRNTKTIKPNIFESVGTRDVQCDKTNDSKIINIPVQASKGFWVNGIDFSPAPSGDAASIVINGLGFSPFQTQVLVNGVALKHFTGAHTSSDSRELIIQNSENLAGNYEVTSSRKIFINLKMKNEFVGTPEITLVSPGRTLTLNNIPMVIRGKAGNSLRNSLEDPMFQSALSVDAVTETSIRKNTNGTYTVSLSGTGFTKYTKVLVAGDRKSLKCSATLSECKSVAIWSDKHLELELRKPTKSKSWSITLRKENSRSLESVKLEIPVPEDKKKTPKKSSPKLAITKVEVLRATPSSSSGYDYDLLVSGNGFQRATSKKTGTKFEANGSPLTGLEFLSTSQVKVSVSSADKSVVFKAINGKGSDEKVSLRYLLSLPKIPKITDVNLIDADQCPAIAGGDNVIITGENLKYVSKVLFGANEAKVGSRGDKHLSVVTPAGNGTVLVSVISDIPSLKVAISSLDGSNLNLDNKQFKYSPHSCQDSPSKPQPIITKRNKK